MYAMEGESSGSSRSGDEHVEKVKLNQRKKKLWQTLSKSVLNRGVVDQMFEKHYQSTDSEDDYALVEQNYVKEKNLLKEKRRTSIFDQQQKDAQEEKEKTMRKYYLEEKSDDEDNMDDEYKKFKRKKRNLITKKRVLRDEKFSNYTKIMLLIKLRVLRGPLYIYSMLECIRLIKQAFILELEQSREVCIPYLLDVKSMPMSFQFYDSISEIVRLYLSPEQKQMLFKEHQLVSKIKAKKQKLMGPKIKDVKLSFGERINRFFATLCNKTLSINDQEYRDKLRLYTKSSSIQSARYIQINKEVLKLKIPNDKQKQLLNQEDQKAIKISYYSDYDDMNPSVTLKKGIGSLSQNKLIKLNTVKKINDEAFQNPNLQVDIQYLTHQQIGRRRANLFNKKLQYQNQLTTLKEKGKRLIICDRLDTEFKRHCRDLENQIEEEYNDEQLTDYQQYKLDMFTKERIEKLKSKFQTFTHNGVQYQEKNIEHRRTQLVNQMKKLPDFNERNRHIDQKITYDQRFFNNGYHEFQLMISDVRKQARLNQEVVKLKQELAELCYLIDQREKQNRSSQHGTRFTRSQSIIQKKDSLKFLQAQLQQQQNELNQVRNDAENNQNTLLDKYKRQTELNVLDFINIKKNKNGSSVSGARSNSLYKESYVRFMEKEDEAEKSGQKERSDEISFKRSSKSVSKPDRDPYREIEQIVEEITESDSDMPNDVTKRRQSHKQVALVQLQVPQNDQINSGLNQQSIGNLSPSKCKSDPPARGQKEEPMETPAQTNRADPASSYMPTVSTSSLLWKTLSNRLQHMNEDDPQFNRIEKLTNKIHRRRQKIKYVAKNSQVALWGKDCSYEPCQYMQDDLNKSMERTSVWWKLNNQIEDKLKSRVQSIITDKMNEIERQNKADKFDDDKTPSPPRNNFTVNIEANKFFGRDSNTLPNTHDTILKNASGVTSQIHEQSIYTFKARN